MSADIVARGLAAKCRADAAAALASANTAQNAAGTAQATANSALGGAAAKTANTAALIAAIRNHGFFPAPVAAAAANNIPIVTIGAANAASPLNGRAAGTPLVLLSDSRIKWLSGLTIKDVNFNLWNSYGSFYGSAGRGANYASFEFNHTGTDIEICASASFSVAANNLRILVNDRIVALASVPWNTGNAHFIRLTFPNSTLRRIRVEAAAGRFMGINVASSGEISATGRNYPLATLVGDSFAEGTGAIPYDGEAVSTLRAIGTNAQLGGVGGTGLLNTGPVGSGRVNWQDSGRLGDLTLAGASDSLGGSTAPAIGLVMLSVNDQGLGSTFWGGAASFQQAVSNAIWKQIDAWTSANPGKPLIFFGPTWPSGLPNNPPVLDIYRIRDAGQEACWGAASANIWFIDRLAQGPLLRAGMWSNAADQASLYTGSDGTHPTPAGHNLDALWMASQLRSLILNQLA